MPNPLELVERDPHALPLSSAKFDPIELLKQAPKPLEAATLGAAGATGATVLKFGLDAYTTRSHNWVQINSTSFQPVALSESTPTLAKLYMDRMSPTVAMAREASANIGSMSKNLALEAKDFAAGARFYTGPVDSFKAAEATRDYLAKLGDPKIAISADAPARKVVDYARSQMPSISGRLEQQHLLRQIEGLELQIARAEQPLVHATARSAMNNIFYGALAGAGSYLADDQLSKLAKASYGAESELGKVLEPTLGGAALTGFGVAMGNNWRTRIAFGATGWLTGKALNYLQLEQ